MSWYKKAQAYDGKIDGVPYKKYEDIAVVNIIHLLDFLDGFVAEGPGSYEKEMELVKQWAERNNAHYYSRPKEDFFISSAIDETRKANKNIVIVEDLS